MFKKNRFNIIILLALSVLIGWSAYLTLTQFREKEYLKKLETEINHYELISQIIHSLQEERKAYVLNSLNMLEATQEELKKYASQTDEKIRVCTEHMNKYSIEPACRLKNDKLKNIRESINERNNFDVCDSYTMLIKLFMSELASVYKRNLPSKIKQKTISYMILATMHEAMTQADQAVTVAANKGAFLNREHYRFLNSALKMEAFRRDDLLLVGSADENKMLSEKEQMLSYRKLQTVYAKLMGINYEDKLDIDIDEWNYNFKIVNEKQEKLGKYILNEIYKTTEDYINDVNSRIYFYLGLNIFVISIVMGSFLLIQRFYNKTLNQKTKLNSFAKAVENSDNNIIITDTNYNITYVNEAFEKNTGYSRKEVMGKNPRFLKSREHNDEYYRRIYETISAGKTWFGEFINKRKDGTLFYEKASISPLIDEGGGILRVISL